MLKEKDKGFFAIIEVGMDVAYNEHMGWHVWWNLMKHR